MIKIYGSSDDLIEVEGDIRKEFCDPKFCEGRHYIILSTGNIVEVYMGPSGGWRATVVHRANDDIAEVFIVDEDNDDWGIRVEGDIQWAALTTKDHIAFR